MIHGDCMEYMAGLPDKAFDLAIVDPPYGINIVDAIKKSTKTGTSSMFKMSKGGQGSDFDKKIPEPEYFKQLTRVSKNQIIWGGNYFLDYLGKTNGFVVWDKMNGENPMADAELAWTSFDSATRMFRMHHFSKGYGEKIHPTQKPVALYKWLLSRYAKPGDRIIDTHGGSGSICIACHDLGFDLTWMELDADYYEAACKRYKDHEAQNTLFEPAELTKQAQIKSEETQGELF